MHSLYWGLKLPQKLFKSIGPYIWIAISSLFFYLDGNLWSELLVFDGLYAPQRSRPKATEGMKTILLWESTLCLPNKRKDSLSRGWVTANLERHGSYWPEPFLFKYFSRTNQIFSRAFFFPLNLTYWVHVINPSCNSKNPKIHSVTRFSHRLFCLCFSLFECNFSAPSPIPQLYGHTIDTMLFACPLWMHATSLCIEGHVPTSYCIRTTFPPFRLHDRKIPCAWDQYEIAGSEGYCNTLSLEGLVPKACQITAINYTRNHHMNLIQFHTMFYAQNCLAERSKLSVRKTTWG